MPPEVAAAIITASVSIMLSIVSSIVVIVDFAERRRSGNNIQRVVALILRRSRSPYVRFDDIAALLSGITDRELKLNLVKLGAVSLRTVHGTEVWADARRVNMATIIERQIARGEHDIGI